MAGNKETSAYGGGAVIPGVGFLTQHVQMQSYLQQNAAASTETACVSGDM